MTSERVIASYFTIGGLFTLAAALIWGVNTLFLLDAGLDIFGSRARSIADGYVVGGLEPLFALPVLVLLRRLGDPADDFAGKKAGIRGTCTAQGIPAISQVDATPVEGTRANA